MVSYDSWLVAACLERFAILPPVESSRCQIKGELLSP